MNLKKAFTIICVALLCCCKPCNGIELGSVRYTTEDSLRFCALAEKLAPYAGEAAPQLMLRVAKEFMGLPYVAGLLEQEPEMLTIDTRHTDCILFVEMCLAATLTIRSGECSFSNFCENTQRLRYQGGVVDGYASRNHYTSSWLLQGVQNGIFDEITSSLGGESLGQTFSFMSTHPSAYKQLAADPALVEQIATTEDYLEGFEYYCLPKGDIEKLGEALQPGDIICFVTSVAGLDISHVAIACLPEGESKMHFIHASQTAGKVIVSPETVAEYVKGRKSARGIRVARLVF